MISVRKKDVLDFVRRDWELLTDSKAVHWAAWKKEHGPAAGIRAGEDLRRLVRLTHPGWPTRRDRQNDLETHARVSAALQSVVPPRSR